MEQIRLSRKLHAHVMHLERYIKNRIWLSLGTRNGSLGGRLETGRIVNNIASLLSCFPFCFVVVFFFFFNHGYHTDWRQKEKEAAEDERGSDSITDSTDTNVSKLQETVKDMGAKVAPDMTADRKQLRKSIKMLKADKKTSIVGPIHFSWHLTQTLSLLCPKTPWVCPDSFSNNHPDHHSMSSILRFNFQSPSVSALFPTRPLWCFEYQILFHQRCPPPTHHFHCQIFQPFLWSLIFPTIAGT